MKKEKLIIIPIIYYDEYQICQYPVPHRIRGSRILYEEGKITVDDRLPFQTAGRVLVETIPS